MARTRRHEDSETEPPARASEAEFDGMATMPVPMRFDFALMTPAPRGARSAARLEDLDLDGEAEPLPPIEDIAAPDLVDMDTDEVAEPPTRVIEMEADEIGKATLMGAGVRAVRAVATQGCVDRPGRIPRGTPARPSMSPAREVDSSPRVIVSLATEPAASRAGTGSAVSEGSARGVVRPAPGLPDVLHALSAESLAEGSGPERALPPVIAPPAGAVETLFVRGPRARRRPTVARVVMFSLLAFGVAAVIAYVVATAFGGGPLG